MILGMTDKPVLRRDGKIRGGEKNGNKLVNHPHFLLHDAEQLIPVLGEKPSEIFFTVPTDNVNEFFRPDLRWYSSSELICRSMHGYQDPATGQNMGSVAAFFKVGQEAAGLSKQPFPGLNKAFKRSCGYKSCPDYVQGKCGEHMFLDIVIPQYSMGAIFTLDSTSVNAILNALSTFQKAFGRYQGRLGGQIFRLYKKNAPISFQDNNGNTRKSDAPVVHVDNVSFADYEAQFRSKIDPVDWEALMYLRNRAAATATNPYAALPGASPAAMQIEGDVDDVPAAMPQTLLEQAAEQNDDTAIAARAEDAGVKPLFERLAELAGKPNTPEMRAATAKHFPNVQKLADYLNGKIKEIQKGSGKAQKMSTPPPTGATVQDVQATTVSATKPAAALPEQPLY